MRLTCAFAIRTMGKGLFLSGFFAVVEHSAYFWTPKKEHNQ
jgi:hypothetical protein